VKPVVLPPPVLTKMVVPVAELTLADENTTVIEIGRS
jgi:hypothetical protein